MVYSGYRANRQEGTAMADVYKQSFKQKTAYEIAQCLVGSEMCIRDRKMDSSMLLV